MIRDLRILKTKKNTTGEVATEQGSAAKTDSKKDGALDICFPPGASSQWAVAGRRSSSWRRGPRCCRWSGDDQYYGADDCRGHCRDCRCVDAHGPEQ